MVKYILSFLIVLAFIIEHSTVSGGGKFGVSFVFVAFLFVMGWEAFSRYVENNW
jgi:hypothetical protein